MNVRSVDHVIVSMDIVLTSPENTNVDVTLDTCWIQPMRRAVMVRNYFNSLLFEINLRVNLDLSLIHI